MNNDKALKDILHQAYCCDIIKRQMNLWLAGVIPDEEFHAAYNKYRSEKEKVYNEEE